MDILMKNLLSSFAVSSREDEVREIIKKEIEDIKTNRNIDIREDVLGNIIVKLGKGNEKVMICTHMDNMGVMITHVENSGFLRISPVGNIKSESLMRSFVKFKNGTIGRIEAAKESPSNEDLLMDIGVLSKEQAYTKVSEGDLAEFTGQFIDADDRIIAPNLHNKICCYVLLNVIREIKDIEKLNKEIYFVFTSQGEFGFKGARAASSEIKPNVSIVLDSIETKDYVGGDNKLKLDCGPIISLFDKNLVIHHEIKKVIENEAEKMNIAIQYSVGEGQNEGGIIHKEAGGSKTAMIGIPCRYRNSSFEMMSLKDIDNVKALLIDVITKVSI